MEWFPLREGESEDQRIDAEQEKEQLMSTVGWEFNFLNLKLQEVFCLAYIVF